MRSVNRQRQVQAGVSKKTGEDPACDHEEDSDHPSADLMRGKMIEYKNETYLLEDEKQREAQY